MYILNTKAYLGLDNWQIPDSIYKIVSPMFTQLEKCPSCCIQWQENIMFCKTGFSKDCAGGEPDSFSSAGMMIEDTEEDCVWEGGRQRERESKPSW